MKRDLELIRRILLEMEADPRLDMWGPPYQLDGVDPHILAYNVVLAREAGLLQAQVTDLTVVSAEPPQVHLRRLTSAGHDFLDAARDETIWRKAEESVKKHGGAFTLTILQSLMEKLIMGQLGLASG